MKIDLTRAIEVLSACGYECDELASHGAEVDELREQLENEQAKGIHSCHKDCKLDGCVNRRLRDQVTDLEKQLADARVGLSYEADIAEMYKEQLAAMTTRNVMLRDALDGVLPWVVTQVVACHGLKCREAVCESCSSEAYESAEIAAQKYHQAAEALAATEQKP